MVAVALSNIPYALHDWIEYPVERRVRSWKDAPDQRTIRML
ncbi:hypothetical protein [Leucobacter luti]|uniref:Uncharacterized protein n=1 Tax=Leucobacter luti TaxID=340320 RepID=A0A4V3CXE0_9MICO|nr:hypothetical protein [Leucobacter luti]TDP89868.1 hypothetical protein EDF62_3166 [Leucobacter luti]